MSCASLAEHQTFVRSGARAPEPTWARVARRALCAWLGLSLLCAAGKAPAQSDVERAGLLLPEASRANDFLGERLADRELARPVALAAEGRLQAAREASVPEQAALAHPHLLVMMEHCERAASAAVLGETARHAEHSDASRDEEVVFRSVMRRLGWSLPQRR